MTSQITTWRASTHRLSSLKAGLRPSFRAGRMARKGIYRGGGQLRPRRTNWRPHLLSLMVSYGGLDQQMQSFRD